MAKSETIPISLNLMFLIADQFAYQLKLEKSKSV